FGAPVAHEDDAERAVRAAFAIQHAVAAMNAADPELGLRVRIGINTGEALVVLGAKPSEGEAMAAGDVINTAARLQTAAPPDGIGPRSSRCSGHPASERVACSGNSRADSTRRCTGDAACHMATASRTGQWTRCSGMSPAFCTATRSPRCP